MSTIRGCVPVLLTLLGVLLAPPPARADQPMRLPTQVTDRAGALSGGSGGDRAAVDAALGRLASDTGIQLFVVFVESFDGIAAQRWTDETASLSDLGDHDALLAVATSDRAYAFSFPGDARLTDDELDDVSVNDIRPALSRGDWSGAVVAGADGYRAAAASSGGSGLIWVLVLFAAIMVGAIVWTIVRRRRATGSTAAAPPAPAGPTLDELTAEANALLIELDDDLRASERELQMATAQYGAPATARFRSALDTSRQDVAEAFRLRMALDEEPAPDPSARRETLNRIISLCRAADTRLDAESEDFDRLRDLEGRAAAVADEVDRRRAELEAVLPGAAAAWRDLDSRYAGPPVTAVSANVEQARERLTFAAAATTRARAAIAEPATRPAGTRPAGAPPTGAPPTGAPPTGTPPTGTPPTGTPPATSASGARAPATPTGDDEFGGSVPGGSQAQAALAVRAAEQAVDQAEQLIEAIHRTATDLDAGRRSAEALILEVEAEVAAGRAALASAGGGSYAAGSAAGAPPGLGEAVARAEQALAEVRAELSGAKPDPIAASARLQAADSALDQALAEARDAAERAARARSLLAQALPVARAEVAAATDFISTRRGAVGSGARTSLSEAQRHLAVAESLAASDPVTAVTEAQQAQHLAANASQYARADVQTWGGGYGGSYGGWGGFDAGSFAGAVLGGILAGGGGRYRSGSGGGFSGGGFGGSSSRSRRTGGGRF